MNWLDIVIALPLLWGLWSGYRKGIFVQVGVLAGLAAGIFIAYFLGESAMKWFNVTGTAGTVVTYIALAGTVMLVVVLVARMVGGLFSSVGLGAFDKLFGALLSCLKVAIIVSLILCGFQWINDRKPVLDESTLNSSLLYNPVKKLTSYAFPYLDKAQEQIEEWNRKDDLPADER